MEIVSKRWEVGSRKTEESANLRFGHIKRKFIKKGNWSTNSCFNG